MTASEAAEVARGAAEHELLEKVREAVRLEMKSTGREMIEEVRRDDDMLDYTAAAPLLGKDGCAKPYDAVRVFISKRPELRKKVKKIGTRAVIRRGDLRAWVAQQGVE